MGMYRGVAFFAKGKVDRFERDGTDTSTMVYDFGSIDEGSRPVQSFYLKFDGWHGLYDR